MEEQETLSVPRYFRLGDDHQLEPATLLDWAVSMETSITHIASEPAGDLWVSTIFTGLDLGGATTSSPLVFETMVFDKKPPGGEENMLADRYHTYEQAISGHQLWCRRAEQVETIADLEDI